MEMIKTRSIKETLKAAYGDQIVFNDESIDPGLQKGAFTIGSNSEEIYYWELRAYTNELNVFIQYRVSTDKATANTGRISELIRTTEKGNKGFLFFFLKNINDILFSVEVIDFHEEKVNQINFRPLEEIRKQLKESDGIIRIMARSWLNEDTATEQSYRLYLVAISLTDSDGNPDYTALKHYIVSSDNRTYNRVVRNEIEYIGVESSETTPSSSKLPHNLLVSGAPGTGKSYFLSEKVIGENVSLKKYNTLFDDDKEIIDQNIDQIVVQNGELNDYIVKEAKKLKIKGLNSSDAIRYAIEKYRNEYVTRVTFFEDYSYEDFIGCYKPVSLDSNDDMTDESEHHIIYDFIPGPFINTYVKAKCDIAHKYYLIIEEINRAKAASVFGDMFQLLDRDEKGESEYGINPDSELKKYLEKKQISGMMKLPTNIYIWATMNTADQGVMPLDSAFKRRWSQIYMDITPTDNDNANGVPIILPAGSDGSSKKVFWENFRKSINDVILGSELGFDEDRCIGPWYFKSDEISQINEYFEETDENIRKVLPNPLVDKLFFYLRQDVFRRHPTKMFRSEEGNNNKKAGITMSDLRRRVRKNESIETILNIDKLTPIETPGEAQSETGESGKEATLHTSRDVSEGNPDGDSENNSELSSRLESGDDQS